MSIKITRAGSQPSQAAPEAYFTGKVRIDSPFKGTESANISGAIVTFEPGFPQRLAYSSSWSDADCDARAWMVTGVGAEIQDIHQGDIVWIPEGIKHWHGATPENAMTHIAIAESLNGSSIEWLEKVTDEQYQK